MKTGTGASLQGAQQEQGTDGRTRDRVARLLLELGPSTAATLGERLGLSPAAVRRHLDAMLAAGTIDAREARSYGRRGRGRPARVYALTDRGRAQAGPTGYAELAVHALRHLAGDGGAQAVDAFATTLAAELEGRIRAEVAARGGDPAGQPADEAERELRVDAVAAALSRDGYAAGVSQVPTGAQLCQHHCPVQHVAAEFPQLCEAETAALAAVLGTHVQRLATIAHGDGVCTTHIPAHIPHTVAHDAPAAPAAGEHPRLSSERTSA